MFHPWNDNDFYNGLLKKLTDEIDSDAEQDSSLKTNCIIVCSECKVPSNRYNTTASDIIRAHSNYQPNTSSEDQTHETKSPWHDWVDVEYHNGSACGRVLLWCWIHFINRSLDQGYVLIQTLTGNGKKTS